MNYTTPVPVDCEIEFAQLPGRVFPVNLGRLGLSLVALTATTPTDSAAPSPPVCKTPPISRLRYEEPIDFPPALVVAFRVHDDSFMLDELQGLSRLLASGFRVLMEGVASRTDLKSALAAMAIQQRLGLSCKVGNMARIKAKTIARDCLEDVLLARDTFKQLSPSSSDQHQEQKQSDSPSNGACRTPPAQQQSTGEVADIEDKLSAALNRIAKLDRENHRLLKALEEAYTPGRRGSSAFPAPPPPTSAADTTQVSPRPVTRNRRSFAAGEGV